MREDTFTRTEADAAAYERRRGHDEYIDNTPTRAELEGESPWFAQTLGPDPWAPFTCAKCGDEDRSGMPETCTGCGFRNYGGTP